MSRRIAPCRNFQRGSCQYGDRCKFLHGTQQQSKPNPFGFGTHSASQLHHKAQQQKPNPFGFGVSNSSLSKGSPNFSAKYQSPAKPFENKWTRSLSIGSTNSTPSQRTDRQPEAVFHKCTDPESCKHQIVEDCKNEAPLWKLTCYGHCKHGPCDIVGDISFEELRARAYEDAARGLRLQSIVEKERNLLNSKLIEFDNLLRNQYVSRTAAPAGASPFPGNNISSSLIGSQSNAPPSFSRFNQPGASTNSGSNIRTNSIGTPPGTVFGQPSLFQSTSQTSGGIGMNFGLPGIFGSQPATHPLGGTFNFSNGAVANSGEVFSFPSMSQQFPSSTNQSSTEAAPNLSLREEREDNSDDSIWMKEEWNIGEIPEEEPPQRFR